MPQEGQCFNTTRQPKHTRCWVLLTFKLDQLACACTALRARGRSGASAFPCFPFLARLQCCCLLQSSWVLLLVAVKLGAAACCSQAGCCCLLRSSGETGPFAVPLTAAACVCADESLNFVRNVTQGAAAAGLAALAYFSGRQCGLEGTRLASRIKVVNSSSSSSSSSRAGSACVLFRYAVRVVCQPHAC
jgi:hypothetical protein